MSHLFTVLIGINDKQVLQNEQQLIWKSYPARCRSDRRLSWRDAFAAFDHQQRVGHHLRDKVDAMLLSSIMNRSALTEQRMRHFHFLARVVCVVSLAAMATSPVSAQTWSVGNEVQYFDTGWWNAVVVEIGSGAHAGEVKVKPDGAYQEKWAALRNIRTRPGPPAAAPASGPRAGDYSILSYGASTYPIRLGKITLAAGGAYRFYDNGDNLLGQGRYSFAGDKVTWLTGILKTQGWGGGFEVDQNGRVHNIRLKSGTIATNAS